MLGDIKENLLSTSGSLKVNIFSPSSIAFFLGGGGDNMSSLVIILLNGINVNLNNKYEREERKKKS